MFVNPKCTLISSFVAAFANMVFIIECLKTCVPQFFSPAKNLPTGLTVLKISS